MLEAPEALIISEQLNQTVVGKKITFVCAGFTPHKFAWFYDNPDQYSSRLMNKHIGRAQAYGGMVEIEIEDMRLLLSDGVNLHFHEPHENIPSKHQLLIGFEDESCLAASVRMYGGLFCFPADSFECNYTFYRDCALNKPQVMSDAFTLEYFLSLFENEKRERFTAKAFLATEQRIPGLGNGVLQDILFNAHIHPKAQILKLTEQQKTNLFYSIKSVMQEIYQAGGREIETDLFGKNGRYVQILSKDTYDKPCPICGVTIKKELFMGGVIYYCSKCQNKFALLKEKT